VQKGIRVPNDNGVKRIEEALKNLWLGGVEIFKTGRNKL
jgi:hypothetical protein